MRRTHATLAAACLLAAVTALTPVQAASAAPRTVSARTLLAHLTVRAEDHAHRYDRGRFDYDDDYDADHDGCDTRKEVLLRDALAITKKSRSCSVAGRWRSLYDGKVYDSPYDLQIDHLVPLAEAWHSGAWAWSHDRQIAFGNDIGYEYDLQAVSIDDNQGKGASEPGEWLPRANRCTYVEAWIAVKSRWHLSVDPAEKADLTRLLAHCGSTAILRPGTPDLHALVG